MAGVGYQQGTLFDESRSHRRQNGPRPLVWSAWYPTASEPTATERFLGPPQAPWFTVPPVVDDAPPLYSDGPFPAVVLSHGTGGTADSLWWLAHRLAKCGFVAIGVNHHGNTAIEPYLPEGFLCWWERAKDLTVLLDRMLGSTGSRTNDSSPERTLGAVIDPGRIHAAGFSLGGYTVLSAVGAVTEMARFSAWAQSADIGKGPAEFPDLADHVPDLMENSAAFRASWARAGGDYRDRRLKSAFLMAPAPPVRGFVPETVAGIRVPVAMVCGGEDAEAPPAVGMTWLEKLNPSFEATIYPGAVGHYVFLPMATGEGMRTMPMLCLDGTGVDRAAIHIRATEAAIRHFTAADGTLRTARAR